jgi:uncharacterized repeat protein (TIGR01451 family)
MLSWLRNLSPSSPKRKPAGNRGRRSLSRSLFRRPEFHLERLEDRALLAADLTLNLSVSPPNGQEVANGEQIVYTIVAGNSGTTAATGVSVTDMVQGELDNPPTVTITGPTSPTPVINGNTVTANLGTVPPNQTYTIIVSLFVGSTASGNFGNVASMTNTSGDTNPNSQSVSNPLAFGSTGGQQGAYLQGVPGDGTISTGITNAYEELLGRQPDPSGLQSWVAFGQATQNAFGDRAVVSGFMNSAEYKEHYVSSVYQIFLGRAPDAAGLAYWTNQMGNPGTPGEHGGAADEKYVLSAVLGSDEFYQHAGATPQGWINALYEDLLGRAADSGGMTFWQNELATRAPGDRGGVVRDLLSTPEAVHDLLDAFYPVTGGTAAAPLPPAGSPAGLNSTKLAELTGGGWENLYFEGPFDNSPQGNDGFYSELVGGASWDDVQYQMLTSQQYFINPNRPVSSGGSSSAA